MPRVAISYTLHGQQVEQQEQHHRKGAATQLTGQLPETILRTAAKSERGSTKTHKPQHANTHAGDPNKGGGEINKNKIHI